MKYIRSPISYSGSKYKLLDWLIPMFPKECDLFIEAFGGSGVVSFNYDGGKDKVYVDELWFLPVIFNYLKYTNLDDLKNKITQYAEQFGLNYEDPKDPASKLAFYNLRNYANTHKQDDDYPLWLLLLSRLCYRHLIDFNKSGDFNGTYGQYKLSPDYLVKVLADVKPKMQQISFGSNNSVEAMSMIDSIDDCSVFIYCDPPYVDTAAKYNKGWSVEDDKRLRDVLDQLSSIGVKFGLSNYVEHNGKVNQALLDWVEEKGYNIYRKEFVYRPTGSDEHKVVEVYVCNYNVTNS